LAAGTFSSSVALAARSEPRPVQQRCAQRSGGAHWPALGRQIDRLFRLGYRCAFQGLRLYWNLAHPATHGALVALWYRGEILIIQNSYVPFRSLPGGSLQRHESGRAAAVRELREEVGIAARAEDLVPVVDIVHEWEGKRDHVEIFELELAARPTVTLDNREVIAAQFHQPEAALAMPLFPPVRLAIERHRQQS
jgi:8-oxo-dGTP diphosphatase